LSHMLQLIEILDIRSSHRRCQSSHSEWHVQCGIEVVKQRIDGTVAVLAHGQPHTRKMLVAVLVEEN
ncbi:hypothetical protein PFISCL1PPCAC_18463, partial [Pristionchus fissidentatus]